jgi:tetratricopeptide (TPR) repeat protein
MTQRESGGAEWMRQIPAIVGGFIALVTGIIGIVQLWESRPDLVTRVVLLTLAAVVWLGCVYWWVRREARWRTLAQIGAVVIPLAVVVGIGYATAQAPATASAPTAASAAPAASADFAKYDAAIRANPQSPRPLVDRATAFYEKKMPTEALRDADAALKLAPHDPGALFIKAITHAAYTGDMDRAIESFNQLLAVQPGHINAYSGRGGAYHRKGEYDKAIADYTMHIKLSDDIRVKPNVSNAYLSRAQAYEQAGDTAKAIADYKTVLEAVREEGYRQQAEAQLKRLGAQ